MTASESPYDDRHLDVQVAEALGWEWCVLKDSHLPGRAAARRRNRRALFSPGAIRPGDAWRSASDEESACRLDSSWDQDLPHYSTDPAAYMGLLAEMEWRGAGAWSLGVANAEHKYACEINRRWGYGNTVGEAICRAALTALGREVPA